MNRNNFNIIKKHEDDGGWNMDKYKYTIVQDLEIPTEENSQRSNVSIPRAEFERWSNANTKIGNFMQGLDMRIRQKCWY